MGNRLVGTDLDRALRELAAVIMPDVQRRQHEKLDKVLTKRGKIRLDQVEGFLPVDVMAGVVTDTLELALGALATGLLKVTTGTGALSTATAADLPTGIDAAKIANGSVSNAEFQYLDGVTSALQTQLNDKMSLSAPTSPAAATLAQSTADTANTTSTVTYADACSLSLVLPAGTWTVHVVGGLCIQNAGGSSDWRVMIDGAGGTERTLTVTTEMQMVDNQSKTGVSGGRTITLKMQYKSNSAGTTNARNPWLMAMAVRTA